MDNNKKQDFIIDIENLVDQLEGNVSFLNEILINFLNNASILLDKLNNANDNNDQKTIMKTAHSITNVFSSVLIYSSSELSKKIEMEAKNNNLDKCKPLIAAINKELNSIFDYIKQNYL